MIMLLLGIASVGIWIYLLLARGRFWDVQVPPYLPPATERPHVVAIVPARDEAASIRAMVAGLLTQDFAGRLDLIVVDDHSTDGTAAIARATSEVLGAADRLTILSAPALPSGWTGKLWAVSAGIAHAETMGADFYLLTDADIVHRPHNLTQLVGRAVAERRDLVSQMVMLRAEAAPERALIPAFVFFFFMLYPPRWAADPQHRLAAAAGGCVLIRPEMLRRIGGIAAIRHRLIDDCALADAVKQAGGRIRLDVTCDALSIRHYDHASDIWQMIARTAFTQLRYSGVFLIGTLLGLGVTYLAPPLLLLFGHGAARWLGAAAWAMMAGAFWPTVRFYGQSPLRAFTLPLIACFYAAATLGSAVNYWRGRGGQWKGRTQAV
jgi:hopene-associated glycosyltransferase HpnB